MARWIYLLFCLAFLLVGSGPPTVAPPALPVTTPVITPPPPPVQVTIAAVGDIMMHTPQVTAAYDPASDTYDFSAAFARVQPYLAAADLTLGNLETPLAGPEKGYPGYPRFNAPDELAWDLKEAGFDVIITANNHALDQGPAGVVRTLETLRAAGLHPVGTASRAAEMEEIILENVRGLPVAILAYTYGTNGLPLPQDQPFLVNLLDKERIIRDIAAARAAGAAVVLVYLHFGREYIQEPDQEVRELVAQLAEAGADIVLGSHPHVLQGGERLGEAGEKLVIYSLGNFISAQKGPSRQTGVIWKICLEQDPSSGKVSVLHPTYLPTYTWRYRESSRLQFAVIPLADMLEAGPGPAGLPPDYLEVRRTWDMLQPTLDKVGDQWPILEEALH